jgi:DNA-binding HxlR family transcriptional regulator
MCATFYVASSICARSGREMASDTESDKTKTSVPKTPGTKVRGSQTGRPIMVLLDVLGQRWTLRVLWELGDTRATFRALRLKCDDVSPTLLNKRLKQLRELGLVDLDDAGYGLTGQGRELASQLVGLDVWATSWAKKVKKGKKA